MAKISKTRRKQPSRSVALLLPDGDALSMEQEADFDAQPPTRQIAYVPLSVARSYFKRGFGTAYYRRGRMTRWEYKPGRVAHVLPPNCEQISLAELVVVREWLESHGANISSVQGSAMSLFRFTLDHDLYTAPGGPPLTRISGGRVHTLPIPPMDRFVQRIAVWDIQAAFGRTLSSFRPCGRWVADDDLRDDGDQFIEARIDVPEMAQWGPLPVIYDAPDWLRDLPRVARSMPNVGYPQGGTLEGIWTGDEIRSAVAHGARIQKLRQAWTLRAASWEPFASWWRAVEEGRALPGYAASFAKSIGNSLWGIFAVSGEGQRRWWDERRPPDARVPNMEWVADGAFMAERRDLLLADLLSARVRARVFDELVYPLSPNVVMVLTDGGMVQTDEAPLGNDWRLKDRGHDCHFEDPAYYAYVSDENGPVYHAGARDAEAYWQHALKNRYGDSDYPFSEDANRLRTAIANVMRVFADPAPRLMGG